MTSSTGGTQQLKIEQVYLAKKEELNRQKQQSVDNEDYEKANYYKAQVSPRMNSNS